MCARQSGCCEQANGKCCYWCVPDNTYKVTFEIWSGGGGGPRHTCCNCCPSATSGEQVETMLPKQLIPILDAHILYVREALGPRVKPLSLSLSHMWCWNGMSHVNGHNLLQTFVLQEAVEAGCVTEMLGVKDTNIAFVLTVTFVEFLVLTSVVWEPWEEKQELQLVDVRTSWLQW